MNLTDFFALGVLAVLLGTYPTAQAADLEPLYKPGLLGGIRSAERLYLIRVDKSVQVPTSRDGLALIKYTAARQSTIRGPELDEKPFSFQKYRIVGTWHGTLETVNSWSHIANYPNEGDLLLSALRREASEVDPASPAREPFDGMALAWAIAVLPEETDAITRLCNLPLQDWTPGRQVAAPEIEAFTKLWQANSDQLLQRHLLDFAAQYPTLIPPVLKMLDPAVALAATQPLDFRNDVVTAFGSFISSDAGPSPSPWLAMLSGIAANRAEDGRLRRHCANAVRMILVGRPSAVTGEDKTMLRVSFGPEESMTMTKTAYNYKIRRNGFGFLPEDRTAELQVLRKEILKLLTP